MSTIFLFQVAANNDAYAFRFSSYMTAYNARHGPQVCKAIKAAYPKMNMLGFSFSDRDQEAMNANGCERYVLKGEGMDVLISVLRQMVSSNIT